MGVQTRHGTHQLAKILTKVTEWFLYESGVKLGSPSYKGGKLVKGAGLLIKAEGTILALRPNPK